MTLDSLVRRLVDALQGGVAVVLLDACRENPDDFVPQTPDEPAMGGGRTVGNAAFHDLDSLQGPQHHRPKCVTPLLVLYIAHAEMFDLL